ncbi:tetratricopeptide repeat protein [Terricaulis sp.]|uniref:tetratricopeptide repeat protein n=1 Tax=Terricaulis sp. TaxID=2768686 RepID=UPI00378515B4
MRWAILAAVAVAAAGSANAQPAQQGGKGPEPGVTQIALEEPGREPASELRTTSPQNAAIDRTYSDPGAALLEADVDYLVREARRSIARGDTNSTWTVLAFTDDLASGRLAEARADLASSQGGVNGPIADLLEPFLLSAEGRADRGVERVDSGADSLPAPLPEVQRALVFEAAGRLDEAAAVYGQMVERLDLTPPGEAEPANLQEFERSLNAARITHAVYRAALVSHRLGRSEEARRYYGIVQQFAPRSIDVTTNLARLDAGQPPMEAPLNAKTALGRWMLFLAEYLTQAENLTQVLSQQDPHAGLSSTTGSLFLQLGLLLAPDAGDWRLYAAEQLADAGGLDGAQRVIDLMPQNAVYQPDADIVRAGIQLERHNDAEAIAAARRAAQAGAQRWAIVASAGDIMRRAGDTQGAIAAFDRALTMVTENKDRADILGWRAYAHRFSGDVRAATADMRQALELDPSVDTRLLYVSILMDDPQAWNDGIRVARQLFAEQPDSVLRLNALGYALIQQPQGLEEGYRLLWRGFNFGQQDYAVIDSLGWAYYLYGHFEDALPLIERANQLSTNDPNPEILDHLGDVYWRLNRRDEARASWQRALQFRPDALRRANLERKIARGLTEPAPRRREPPQVNLPTSPAQRGDL